MISIYVVHMKASQGSKFSPQMVRAQGYKTFFHAQLS